MQFALAFAQFGFVALALGIELFADWFGEHRQDHRAVRLQSRSNQRLDVVDRERCRVRRCSCFVLLALSAFAGSCASASYEGLANRPDPERCAASREGRREAFTGETTGQVYGLTGDGRCSRYLCSATMLPFQVMLAPLLTMVNSIGAINTFLRESLGRLGWEMGLQNADRESSESGVTRMNPVRRLAPCGEHAAR